jgi:hypothetical protein
VRPALLIATLLGACSQPAAFVSHPSSAAALGASVLMGEEGALGSTGSIGSTGAAGPQGQPTMGPAGASGATGPTGDAALDVFGDGADGDLVISSVSGPAPELGKQYNDCTITAPAPSGYKVASGTVIRCAGTFVVASGALLRVTHFARGGNFMDQASVGDEYAGDGPRDAHPGLARTAAAFGAKGPSTLRLGAGFNAIGFGAQTARGLLRPGLAGGGGGGGSIVAEGGSGGGTLVVLAREGIVIDGTIRADGSTPTVVEAGDGEAFGNGRGGVGGGGGGIVVLASQGGIAIHGSTGAVQARGGHGGHQFDSSGGTGAGGGGGGGLVHTVSPFALTGFQNIDVSAGIYGPSGSVIFTKAFRAAGGGGGASCGDGGVAMGIESNGTEIHPSAEVGSGNGSIGCAIHTPVDPARLDW